MAENNKKRAGSFRKLFPNLFFSHKSKEKNANKDSQSNTKSVRESSKGNQYQNPRSIRSDKNAQGLEVSERIYENLTSHRLYSDNETQRNEISSHHSSSSTLVSESTKNKSIDTNEVSEEDSIAYINYAARPQVPPKPYNDMGHSPHTSNRGEQLGNCDKTQYPDVYYHSLEKLTDKISPFDEIEIYRASQAQANPASVGAEIKRVSTKFLISPKKEAEVRTIQPTRARSLSFDNNKENEQDTVKRCSIKKQESIQKPYNYSAPTSPMPISHKLPNMPKTVSPYEHVRKAMIETEEKRNSLNRTSLRNKSTPSPRSEYSQRLTPTLQENSKQGSSNKEKTRQKVEAFYWQKLKELKQKEDEYLIKQSLNSSMRRPEIVKTSANSIYSIPNSFSYVMEPRSCSLPRGNDFKSYSMNQPIYTSVQFARGAPERRTDSFIKRRTHFDEPEIIYRHPEKLFTKIASPAFPEQKMPIYYHGTIPQEIHSKRVSFEKQYGKAESVVKSGGELRVNDCKMRNRQTVYPPNNDKVSESKSRVPPQPPVRTTSVGGALPAPPGFKCGNNVHLTGAGHSLCSESESGSEAGEIQRIMQGNEQKDSKTEDYYGDLNSTNFYNWVDRKLIPKLPPNSVIVMDNAAYHCVQVEKKPTMSCLKMNMQNWLQNHNVTFSPTMVKAEFLGLINTTQSEKIYTIDEVLKGAGHTVLRLPPYHPDLNAIELVWANIKNCLARDHINATLDEKITILTRLSSEFSAKHWQKCDDHVQKNEHEYWNHDMRYDTVMDEFIINLQDDSEDVSE